MAGGVVWPEKFSDLNLTAKRLAVPASVIERVIRLGIIGSFGKCGATFLLEVRG